MLTTLRSCLRNMLALARRRDPFIEAMERAHDQAAQDARDLEQCERDLAHVRAQLRLVTAERDQLLREKAAAVAVFRGDPLPAEAQLERHAATSDTLRSSPRARGVRLAGEGGVS